MFNLEPDYRSEDSEEREILEDEQDESSEDEQEHDELAKIVLDVEDHEDDLKQVESGHSSHKHQTRRNSEDALRILEDSIINDALNQQNYDATQVVQTEPSIDDVSQEQ